MVATSEARRTSLVNTIVDGELNKYPQILLWLQQNAVVTQAFPRATC